MLPSSSVNSDPCGRPDVIAYSALLAESYRHWTRVSLVTPTPQRPATALYHAPFALVSHGIEPDPVFRYANLAAQALWGIGWDAFTRMPSRLTAEPIAAGERQRLLDEAARTGYVDRYQGVRVTAGGRRFLIKNTILWNVVDQAGSAHGQAAAIKEWEWL
jgi:MEKHLA domain